MGIECCDNDLLWSGRCTICPYYTQCTNNTKEEIKDIISDKNKNSKSTEDVFWRTDNWDDL